jgi:hypothetical protein
MKATIQSTISPLKTRYPAKGIIISEGNGMQADSMAINKTIPPYPILDMTLIIQTANNPINFSSMRYSPIKVDIEFYRML